MLESTTLNDDEGESIEVCWSLLPTTLTFERPINFIINAQPLSAITSDYGGLPQVVVPSATNEVCVDVALVEDDVIESFEVFELVIVNTDSAIQVDQDSLITQVSVCLSLHLSICMSCLLVSVCLTVPLFVSVCLSVCLSDYLNLSLYQSVCLSVCLSVPSLCLCQSVHLCLCLSV